MRRAASTWICSAASPPVRSATATPRWWRRCEAQLDKLWHVSNVFYSQPQIDLAARLTARLGAAARLLLQLGRARPTRPCSSWRARSRRTGATRSASRSSAFDNSFHGRTLATVTATGQPKYHKGFEPLPPGFTHVPYGDLEAVRKAVGPQTAAILVEPIQGEGGVRVAPAGLPQGPARAVRRAGAAACWWTKSRRAWAAPASSSPSSTRASCPDAISLAKALGNGLPIGAMLCTEEAGKSLTPGTHGSTFGGNLIAAAAANVVTRKVTEPQMLRDVGQKGEYFLTRLREMQSRVPTLVKEVRGLGLLVGVELFQECAPIIARCRELGMLVNAAGEKTIRFAPAYTVSHDELDQGVRIFERALKG